MALRIKGILIIIIFMGLDYIIGLIKENIKVNGKIIKCMEKDYFNGQMDENTKDNM